MSSCFMTKLGFCIYHDTCAKWQQHLLKPTVTPKGNQPWILIGRTDAEAVAPVFWPRDAKNWLLGNDTDARKDWRQEEKETTEDEIASPTQWTWVWVSSGSWWWTGKPGALQSMGWQRVGRDWATEQPPPTSTGLLRVKGIDVYKVLSTVPDIQETLNN